MHRRPDRTDTDRNAAIARPPRDTLWDPLSGPARAANRVESPVAILHGLGEETGRVGAILAEVGYQTRIVANRSEVAASATTAMAALVVVGDDSSGPHSCTRGVREAAGEATTIVRIIESGASDEREEEELLLGADFVLPSPVRRVPLLALARANARRARERAALEREWRRIEAEHEELSRQVLHDALTALPNRRFFEQRLAEEVERAVRYGQALTVMMVDVDHFKRVNDTHGHAVGDAVLKGVGGLLSRWVRKCDFVARIGGEEFVVIAPATPREGAMILGERLRAGLDTSPLVASTQSGMHAVIRVTASVGVACFDPHTEVASTTIAALVEAADAALYRAKNAGRNRVECA